MLDDLVRVAHVDEHVQGKAQIRGADPRRIEREASDLQREADGVLVLEGPVQNRLAVPGRADDVVGRPLADLDPVSFGIDQVELVLVILSHLPTDESPNIEVESGCDERLLVFLGHPANLFGKEIRDFE